MTQSTLDNNQVTFGDGGGINNWYKMWITNTTTSMNEANGKGGGIYSLSYYGSSLVNVTLAANIGNGENIYRDTTASNNGAVSLKNTILYSCPSCGNCAGGAITSQGYSIDSGNT